MRALVIASLTLPLLVGCASKQAEKPIETTPASNNEQKAADPGRKAGSDADSSSDKVSCEEAKVRFEFNSTTLPSDAKSTLEKVAACLKSNAKVRITIEGNADERGTEEYNLSLGENRAQAVARYLELLGADRDRVKTVSYGKANPECSEHDEACWARNRRAALKPTSK